MNKKKLIAIIFGAIVLIIIPILILSSNTKQEIDKIESPTNEIQEMSKENKSEADSDEEYTEIMNRNVDITQEELEDAILTDPDSDVKAGMINGEYFIKEDLEEDTRTQEEVYYDVGKEDGLTDEEIKEKYNIEIPESRKEGYEPSESTSSTDQTERPPIEYPVADPEDCEPAPGGYVGNIFDLMVPEGEGTSGSTKASEGIVVY